MRSKINIMFVLAMVFTIALAGTAMAMSAPASSETPGQALVFGYYDTRLESDGGPGLTDNYFTVVNTVNYYTQAHVRVRTGTTSIELLDFDVIMTPYDVFAFDLYQRNGHIVFASCDTHTLKQSGFTLNYDRNGDGTNDCVIMTSDPASAYYQPNLISLIKTCTPGISDDDAVKETLKGYVEVIQEGNFILSAAPCNTVPPGTTLRDWNKGCTVNNDTKALAGKVYYADVAPGLASVDRLGDLNAYSIRSFTGTGVILHKNDYISELNSPTGPGYAYREPYTAVPAVGSGAQDINYCFYRAGAPGNPVINRVGAAATFGPTLADFEYPTGSANIGRQSVAYPVDWRRTVAQVDSLTYDIFNTLTGYNMSTSTALSHFFNLPPLMQSSFVFTFPTKHFIDQKIQVQESLAYDTEENDCIIPPGKFISPGLPGAPTYAQEVSITTPSTCPAFAEGWRAYSLNVAGDGVGPKTGFYDYYNDKNADDRNVAVKGYSPLAIPFVMTSGANAFSTSPMIKIPGSGLWWKNN